ncbi:efflux RND transporter periplasmic adaptor subunit [Sinimarinibacterium sp. CAU 1509]|uniref:efflux RND transporter periplasmic adaptor subunit n=1 Tax=Sinimarinibacterium sp. CAU 1509 TaxID=2562283 RepID=UPI0010AC0264|nr:efflux RND transporter periplasmic adaptor subunit [Sinimarinibacterium sp. CAU 1509]TJY63016.1 efflux RND transporter periplasmic adaptor subunit [Sinimarinibacterium sp. CAU 1509]
MSRTSRRWLLPGFIAAAIVVAIALAYRTPAIDMATVDAARGPVQVVIEEDGVTRVRERYTVTPPVTGYVARLDFHVGDPVKVGQTLFSLEPLPSASLDARTRAEATAAVARAEAAQRAAETAAQAAQASADFARSEVNRLKPLMQTGAISRNQYEQASSEANRTAANLASARSAIEVARYERVSAETALNFAGGARQSGQQIVVTSPVSGSVLAIQREDEGVVQAGTPMLTIGDPHSLEIVVDVLSADAVRLLPGMPVWLERWGGDAPLEARVREVEPTAFTKVSALGVEEQRVRVIADITAPVEQWQRLGDAYRVEARFILHDQADVLRIPHSALFRDNGQWSVFVVDQGRAHLRAVKPGARGLQYTEILEGLAAGDRVIAYPDDRIADGTRVSPHLSAD